MSWVYGLPLWAAAIAFIGGAAAISAAGLLAVRRRYPRADTITHNDVAGPVMTTIGTVLAVLLTFMVVTMWQEYDAAALGASSEAASLADIYHESFALPDDAGPYLRANILRYLTLVVHEEWPLMRTGGSSSAANRIAYHIINRVESLRPNTMGAQIASADALHHVHAFIDARRNRLFNNQQSVPGLIWSMMLLVAAITIASSYFFRVANARAHMMMTLALGAVVGATFLMIAELDLPFRGPLQIRPDAFSQQIVKLPRVEGTF